MILPKHCKLLMIGDSITDAGRAQPVGEGLFDAVGKGYVANIDALLGAAHPEHAIRIINMGTSGNTVRDLAARWQHHVLDPKPDWVAVMIGVNDVWRQFDSPRQTEQHVRLDEYEATLRDLVQRTRPVVQGMILLAPFYLEPNRKDAMRAMVDRYGRAMAKIARAHDCLFVDTQAAFDQALAHYYPATLAWDRVHPNSLGCMIIARAFLKAVGFAW